MEVLHGLTRADGPADCLGFCDKSLMATCVAGHVGRFSAAQFGHKVSNTGLAVLTDAVVKYASKELKVKFGGVCGRLPQRYRYSTTRRACGIGRRVPDLSIGS